MKLSVGVISANLVAAALLLWLYGGDVLDHRRALSSEVSAMTELPRAGYAWGVLVALLLGAAVVALGALTKKGTEFKGYRVLPIVAAVALFVDLFVVSADKVPVSSAAQLEYVMSHFAGLVNEASSPTRVLADERKLRELVEQLGPPPYLLRGQPAEKYLLQVRRGCEGAVEDAPGTQAVTLVYCLKADETEAWLSAVALPAGKRFGAPQVFARDGAVRWASIQPRAPEDEGRAGEQSPFDRAEPAEEARP
jgi:hypothetical protein